MSTLAKTYLTPEQYLEMERQAEVKSEYYRGEVFAMSGAQTPHIRIVANLMRELGNELGDGPCEPFSNDMRVCVGPADLYTYPDVIVACGEPRFLDSHVDTLLNPKVIVEVLSESTEAYDRGRKFEMYRSLESLAEYVLISSLRVSVERYTRLPDGSWNYWATSRLEDSMELRSVGCRLPVAKLYKRVAFTQPPAPAEA